MSGTAYGALLDAVRGVHWPARRAVTSSVPGTHHSTLRGTSAEFSEYRAYRQGDDTRRIDWRLLARSDRAYVRVATDRAILPTTIVLDTSASMAFPIVTRAKWTLAQEIAVGLAAVAHADGDPVGCILRDARGEIRALSPRTRRDVVSEISRTIGAAEPDGSDGVAPLVALARTPRVAVITDLLGDADELLRAARVRIAAGADVYVVHVVAREELDPPHRAMLAADPEAPAVQRMLDERTRRDYVESFGAWRSEVARAWRAAGASYAEVCTDEPAAHVVRRVAQPPVARGAIA